MTLPSSPWDSLYARHTPSIASVLGGRYAPPKSFEHAVSHLVAEIEPANEDGYSVRVYEIALPARFFRIKGSRWGKSVTVTTGTGQGKLAGELALAMAGGMLGIDAPEEAPGDPA